MKLFSTNGVGSRMLRKFVKNHESPCGVIVLVKGISINKNDNAQGYAEISYKFMPN